MTRARLTLAACLTLALALPLCFGHQQSAQADHHAKKKDKADAGWVSLIPKKGLDGWATKKNKTDNLWKLEDGVIVGENPKKNGSDLWTKKEYGDYELIVEYKTPSKDYDSGVFLRGGSHQVQIGISRSLKRDLTACLYCPRDGNGKYPQQPHKRVEKTHKKGDWNTLRMIAKGKHITTYLNGVMINDYTGKKFPAKGKIGLQLHANVHQKMLFRKVMIREIK